MSTTTHTTANSVSHAGDPHTGGEHKATPIPVIPGNSVSGTPQVDILIGMLEKTRLADAKRDDVKESVINSVLQWMESWQQRHASMKHDRDRYVLLGKTVLKIVFSGICTQFKCFKQVRIYLRHLLKIYRKRS
jgi:hypothetical protein